MSTPNNSSDNNITFIRVAVFVVILLIATGTVIFLKKSSDVSFTPEGIAARDSIKRMAHPDTTEAPNAIPRENVADYPDMQDSLTTDIRVPSDAGYEDGYYAGITDGVTGDERASYDESSKFPNPAQRRNYAEAYRRGYTQGFNDGLEGKQFGVTNFTPEEEEIIEETEENAQQ